MIFAPITLVCLFLLLRSVLILIGWLKGPIIQTFEKYGDQETPCLPLISVTLWSGVLLIMLGTWLSSYTYLSPPLTCLGGMTVFAVLLAYQHIEAVQQWHYRLARLPRWYHELRERTTRYERRRIAYMWLRMPWRARLFYSSDDRAFLLWADYIIMGTTMDEEDELFTMQEQHS